MKKSGQKKGGIRAVTLVTPTSICEGTMNLCSCSTYAWKKKKKDRKRGSECSERTRPFLTTKWDPGLIGSLVRVVRRDHWGIGEQEGQRVILGQWRSSNSRSLPVYLCAGPGNKTASLPIWMILKENETDRRPQKQNVSTRTKVPEWWTNKRLPQIADILSQIFFFFFLQI